MDEPQREERERGRAKLQYYTTLTGLIKTLEGQPTIIDLRNESYVSGIVYFVDSNMNVEMRQAVYCDAHGVNHYFTNFLVKNRLIRYVHIPEKLNPQDLLNSLYRKMGRSGKQPERKAKSFKEKRAMNYNQEVIRENYQCRPGPSGYNFRPNF